MAVEDALRYWLPEDDTNAYQPAGRAMSKALRALGITSNPAWGTDRSTVAIRTDPTDSYSTVVLRADAEKLAAQLWKDPRVIEVSINTDLFPKPKTVEEAEKELQEFKYTVYRKAKELAKQHDWCSVVDRALADLGIEAPPNRARVVVEVNLPENVDATDVDAVRAQIREDMKIIAKRNQIRDGILSTEKI